MKKVHVPLSVSYYFDKLSEKTPFHVKDNYAEELRGIFEAIAKSLAKYDHERYPVLEGKRKKGGGGTGPF